MLRELKILISSEWKFLLWYFNIEDNLSVKKDGGLVPVSTSAIYIINYDFKLIT